MGAMVVFLMVVGLPQCGAETAELRGMPNRTGGIGNDNSLSGAANDAGNGSAYARSDYQETHKIGGLV